MADEVQNAAAPANVPARLDRADRLSFAITTLIALTVYLFTLAPEVTVTWSGVMTTGAAYGGVGPPSGYPMWTLYSWLFIKLLPFSNPAWRVAVGAAVAAAATCGFVSLTVSASARTLFCGSPAFERFNTREQNLIRIVCGCVAGLALGLSGRFWYEAVIQEYWTFDALLFAAAIWFLTRWTQTRRRCFCWALFFVYGLLLTNNELLIVGLPGLTCAVLLVDTRFGRDLSLVVLPLGALLAQPSGSPIREPGFWNIPLLATFGSAFLPALILATATRNAGSEWKSALACTLFLVLGLAPYFYLPIASMTNPPMNWGYPRTVEGFFHVISRGQYEKANPTDSLVRLASQLWALLNQTGREFGWIYLLFAALPFCLLWRLNPMGRRWLLSLLPIFLCVGPGLVALLNISMDRQSGNLFEPYFFALRALLAVWAGIGLIIVATMTSRAGQLKGTAVP